MIHRNRQSGFSLLEVVLSISLLVVLMSMMFWFYGSSLDTVQEGTGISRDAQLARVVLRRISDELRQANGFVTGFGVGIRGMQDKVEIHTTTLPSKVLFEKRTIRDNTLPGQHDVIQVRYSIAWDEDNPDDEGNPVSLGLARHEVRTLNQLMIVEGDAEDEASVEDGEASVVMELYAPELKYLRFSFFDGAEWRKQWNPPPEGNTLPQAIRVTVGYTPAVVDEDEFSLGEEDGEDEGVDGDFIPPKNSYTTVVRLPLADTFFGSRMVTARSSLGGG